MKRANDVLRRSSVKLKSLSTGNVDLQMIISQIKDVKCSFKSFMDAQEVLADDLYVWSKKLDNAAIQSSFSYMNRISTLWTETQKAFYETIKKYKEEFEHILEEEKHVNNSKKNITLQQEVEAKAKRELQKATKKGCLQEIEVLRAKVKQAEKSKELARTDFSEKLRENEAVKMIRVKESSLKLGAAYHEMASKCTSLFHAHHLIAQEIPDVHGKEINNIRFSEAACQNHMTRAEERMAAYNKDAIRRVNTIGPVRRNQDRRSIDVYNRSGQSMSINNRVESSSIPTPIPTAPIPSLSSSMSSVVISNATNNAYPQLENIHLNNLNTDRSNEKSHYRKMSGRSSPEGESESNQNINIRDDRYSQTRPPAFNPYRNWDGLFNDES